MTRIIVVRHGQTAWNEGEGERLRGRADIELDQTGIRQAKATAARVAQWKVAAIYSSPLNRAVGTANIVAEPLKLPVQPMEGLIDIDYGRWQSLSLEEAKADDHKLYYLWLKSPHLVTFPQGESLKQVQKRVVPAFESLVSQHPGQDIALVSHKVVCKVLFCSLLGLDVSHFWQLQQNPCAINVVEVEDNALAIVSLNDTCHLKELE